MLARSGHGTSATLATSARVNPVQQLAHVLYAIWKLAGEHMRQLLHGFTLADVASVAEGQAPWPDRASIVAALVDPV